MLEMLNIVIVGSSGHAKVVVDIVEKQGHARIAGLIDSFRNIGETTLDYRVLGSEASLPRLAAELGLDGCIIAIGDNGDRAHIAGKVIALCPQMRFVTAIHPAASIGKGVSIGDGTVIMAGAAVNPGCSIGRLCIINTHASLDHDCVMGEFSSLAPGVTTGGNCHIGTHAAVGIGAILRHGVSIGENSVVGAGSTVLKAVGDGIVVYGTPARKIRNRLPGERYL